MVSRVSLSMVCRRNRTHYMMSTTFTRAEFLYSHCFCAPAGRSISREHRHCNGGTPLEKSNFLSLAYRIVFLWLGLKRRGKKFPRVISNIVLRKNRLAIILLMFTEDPASFAFLNRYERFQI